MALGLTPLRDALGALNKSLGYLNSDLASDPGLREQFRAASIHAFEFSYEMCWKLIKRWLEMNVGPTAADGVTRRELFRLAAENRLIVDVDAWMLYHDARNQTTHTYDPGVAETVCRAAYGFALDAQRLLEALQARND